MGTKIRNLSGSYAKFSELLPDELFEDTIANELAENKSVFCQVFEEDLTNIKELLQRNNLKFPSINSWKPADIIRKAFPLKNDKINRKTELIKRMLAQWWICRETLAHLSEKIIIQLDPVKQEFTDYKQLQLGSRKKRIAFIDLTRSFQKFIGYAINILDIINEYIDTFDRLCKEVDPNYEVTSKRLVSAVSEYELKHGILELLLRGNFGRFTAFPLIRSLIEVMVTRRLLNTEYSTRYKGKQVITLRGFGRSDICKLMQNMNVESNNVDSADRLYDWGSTSTHRGVTIPHSGIWYALLFAMTILSDSLTDGKKFGQKIDNILDEYLADNKIKIV